MVNKLAVDETSWNTFAGRMSWVTHLAGLSSVYINQGVTNSVADPGCLSRIPDPDFYPSRIPDPKTTTKERGEKKFYVIPFYLATNLTKLYIILVLKC